MILHKNHPAPCGGALGLEGPVPHGRASLARRTFSESLIARRGAGRIATGDPLGRRHVRPALRRETGTTRSLRWRRRSPERIRLTDEAGWLDDRQLCALLPCYRPRRGARQAGRGCFASALPENVPTPVCTIFVYPGRSVPRARITSPRRAEEPAVACAGRAPGDAAAAADAPCGKRVIDGGRGRLVGAGGALSAAVVSHRRRDQGVLAGAGVSSGSAAAGGAASRSRCASFRTMVVDAEARKAAPHGPSTRQDGPALQDQETTRA